MYNKAVFDNSLKVITSTIPHSRSASIALHGAVLNSLDILPVPKMVLIFLSLKSALPSW
ncbi:MAG: hypothetical protein KAW83_00095 [Dehalococcoidia bacterium]|nr:hypothetical protein [Dehalococcoidia bacterium]